MCYIENSGAIRKRNSSEKMPMKEKWKMGRTIFATIGGWVGWFLGGMDGFMYAMITFVLLDYITGVLAAAVNHELSSEIGAKGIAKKVGEFILVGVANILDREILRQGAAMRTLVIFFYIANEGLSITENLARMGIVIPRPLRDFLKQLREENNKKKSNKDKKKETEDGNDGKEEAK